MALVSRRRELAEQIEGEWPAVALLPSARAGLAAFQFASGGLQAELEELHVIQVEGQKRREG